MCNESGASCGDGCRDEDGDGVPAVECGGTDCDDSDPDRFPGNVEVCDTIGHDEDCDDTTVGPDIDGDGYSPRDCCNGSTCGTDCDDNLSGINPGAVDGCGGGDEDCDGTFDESPDSVFYRDQDGDNYGDSSDTVEACSQPPGYASTPGDCRDDPSEDMPADGIIAREINPGESDVCDELDNDCDGTIDERGAGVVCGCTTPGATRGCGLADPSLDGVGICRLGVQMCNDGSWTSCVDAVPDGGMEICDSDARDEDCDGESNEGCECVGTVEEVCDHLQGRCATGVRRCDGTGSWLACSIAPATEVCDGAGVDEDCDGEVNEGCDCTGSTEELCDHLLGACAVGVRRCADGMWGPCSITPSAELCGGGDEDCDGGVDEGVDGTAPANATTFYRDQDEDTYGDPTTATTRCTSPYARFVTDDPLDCNDSDPNVRPGVADPIADGVDQNCDGNERCYVDADDDGYRTTQEVTSSDPDCNDSGEALSSATVESVSSNHCCDTDPMAHPGQGFLTPDDGATGIAACIGTGRVWDYNCDGTEESENIETTDCGSFGGSCTEGRWQGGLPSCGNTGLLMDECLFCGTVVAYQGCR